MELKDKVAWITGGASGLGAATVDLLVKNGVKVMTTDINDELGMEIIPQYGEAAFFFKADVTKTEENQFILYPFDDSPAALAGIESGAILLAVDGSPLTPDMSLNTVVSMVRGPIGDKVELTIINPSTESETVVVVKRDSFNLPSVFWRKLEQNPEVGLIDVNIIASSTAEEITEAVNEMQAENVKYFILDLRGNTGGLLEAGIDIARLFLEDGEIISLQYKGQDTKKFEALIG